MPVITGAASYPEHLEKQIADKGAHLLAFDALKLAQQSRLCKSSQRSFAWSNGQTSGY